MIKQLIANQDAFKEIYKEGWGISETTAVLSNLLEQMEDPISIADRNSIKDLLILGAEPEAVVNRGVFTDKELSPIMRRRNSLIKRIS